MKRIIGIFCILMICIEIKEAAYDYCDYYYNIKYGNTYNVQNNEYPGYYTIPADCRWVIKSPNGTQIYLKCSEVYIPWSIDCTQDKIMVALDGDVKFKNSRNYCGAEIIELVSDSNEITLGLVTALDTTGGRFSCTVQVLK